MSHHARTLGQRGGLALVAGIVGVVGCAHSQDERAASVSELNRTVQSLRAQNTAYQKQVEELENRVFIMSDQLESKREASGERRGPAPAPAPSLPRVTLRPSDRHGAPPEGEEATTDPSNPDVEYAGEAAKSSAKRPLLRLYGDEDTLPVIERERERERAEDPPRRLAVSPPEARPEPRAVSPRPAAPAGSAELYRRALEALRGGRHVEAQHGFREFLKQHPHHDFADNAQYWLGECYYDQKDYPMALREFRRVVEKYAQGNKVADALLKVGFSHLALGSAEVGRQTLEQVVRSYPQSEAAVLAGARLRELSASAAKSTARPAEETP
jgi:tol-pal system protein YbgF